MLKNEALIKYLKRQEKKYRPYDLENGFPYSMGHKAGQYRMIKKINRRFSLGISVK